jgi:hypothetical protein
MAPAPRRDAVGGAENENRYEGVFEWWLLEMVRILDLRLE